MERMVRGASCSDLCLSSHTWQSCRVSRFVSTPSRNLNRQTPRPVTPRRHKLDSRLTRTHLGERHTRCGARGSGSTRIRRCGFCNENTSAYSHARTPGMEQTGHPAVGSGTIVRQSITYWQHTQLSHHSRTRCSRSMYLCALHRAPTLRQTQSNPHGESRYAVARPESSAAVNREQPSGAMGR